LVQVSASPLSLRLIPCLTALALVCLACEDETAQRGVDAGETALAPPHWNREISLHEAPDQNPDPAVVEVELEARVEQVELAPGQHVSMWTYDGLFPGPLIRAKAGQTLRVHFTNNLPEPTTIHWHGLEVDNEMDGAPPVQSPVIPGESFDYELRLPHAGTFWYHPHVDSSAQLWRGLYGPMVIDEPEEPALGREAVIVLDDILLEADGSLASPEENGNLGDFFGREGDTMLVNGRVQPTIDAHAGDALRLRFINVSNSHYFKPSALGHPLWQIGSDGGFLERPVEVSEIPLSPGERADSVLFVEGEPGEVIEIVSRPYPRYACGAACWPEQPLFRIRVVAGRGAPVSLPTRLTTIEAVDVSAAVAQTIRAEEGSIEGQAVLGFNGVFPPDELMLEAKTGETLVWTLENPTDYGHPFHLHGFRFQVLSIDGTKPAVRAWKDTLALPPQSTSVIAMQLDDRAGHWMFHCHILDHAKIGMMGMLHVAHGH
jgi:FtsP/CotA-like multicopper oxidase with cupredoxin domain